MDWVRRNPQSSSCSLCCFIVFSLYFIHFDSIALCLCCFSLWVQFQWVLWVLSWVFVAMNFRGLFNGSFCFLWVSGFSLGLGFFCRSLLFYRLFMLLWTKFFCLYFLHGTITSCREILFVVLFIGSTTNVCLCLLIKILLDYCNKETGVAILNFFIT